MWKLIALGLVLAAAPAVAGVQAWPPRTTDAQTVARAVATHVASRYLLSEYGGRLVSIAAGEPALKDGTASVPLKVVAVRKRRNSNAGVAVYPTGKTVVYRMCGSARGCSIPGAATLLRGRLVRREALELALDTFTYAPSVDAVMVFAPPAPGKSTGFVVYLRRSALAQPLGRPRRKTLPVDPPPFPGDTDKLEAATIDKLTLPRVYGWAQARLKGGGRAMVLDPLT